MFSKIYKLIFGTDHLSLKIIPGIILAISFSISSHILNHLLPQNKLSNPILITIILAIVCRNLFPFNPIFKPGVKFGIKRLLRFGIILMGIRLSFLSFLKIGSLAFILVFICILFAFTITLIFAKKLKVKSTLSALIAAGTSICGVSAIVATAPTIKSSEEETSYAIGTITIFGILSTITYPYLVETLLSLNIFQAGFFMGTSIHDTSQVTAAAMIYNQIWQKTTANGLTGGDIAIATKLVRNTFMIIVIPILFLVYGGEKTKTGNFKIANYIPLFVLGYLCFGVIRSSGDFIFGTTNTQWIVFWKSIKTFATHIITVSLTCIGFCTDLKKIFQLGYKPFICGLIAALSVGGVSYALLTVFKNQLSF